MQHLIKLLSTIVLTICLSTNIISQDSATMTSRPVLGVEAQVYPTGIIPGLRFEHPLSTKSNIHLRVGYQVIDHRDLGVQADETGSGYGFSIGYKRFFNESKTKWSLMLKSDVWFNTIDWVDESDNTGTSDVTVLQPTLQLEYGWMVSDRIMLAPSIAFGLEWNVKTTGADTGEGPILLAGVCLGYAL